MGSGGGMAGIGGGMMGVGGGGTGGHRWRRLRKWVAARRGCAAASLVAVAAASLVAVAAASLAAVAAASLEWAAASAEWLAAWPAWRVNGGHGRRHGRHGGWNGGHGWGGMVGMNGGNVFQMPQINGGYLGGMGGGMGMMGGQMMGGQMMGGQMMGGQMMGGQMMGGQMMGMGAFEGRPPSGARLRRGLQNSRSFNPDVGWCRASIRAMNGTLPFTYDAWASLMLASAAGRIFLS